MLMLPLCPMYFNVDLHLLLLTSCVLLISVATIIVIFYFVTFLFQNWEDNRSTNVVWKSKHPSFEELHALFDRGDLMLSTVLIASSLQFSHPKLAKSLQAHSTYKTDPWRRIIRTTDLYLHHDPSQQLRTADSHYVAAKAASLDSHFRIRDQRFGVCDFCLGACQDP